MSTSVNELKKKRVAELTARGFTTIAKLQLMLKKSGIVLPKKTPKKAELIRMLVEVEFAAKAEESVKPDEGETKDDGKPNVDGDTKKENAVHQDTATGTTSLTVFKGHTDSVVSVLFSSDSSFVVSGSIDNTIRIWNVTSGTLTKTIDCPNEDFSSDNYKIALSPNDKYIVSLHCNPRLWSVESGKCLKTFIGREAFNTIAFSSDSKYILSGSSGNKGSDDDILGWDIESGQMRTLGTHKGELRSLACSLNGGYAATAGDSDGSVRLWQFDWPNFSCIKHFEIIENKECYLAQAAVAISPCKPGCRPEYVASGCFEDDEPDGLYVWDVDSGTCRGFKHPDNGVWSVAFSSTSKYIAAGSCEEIKIWNVESGCCIKTLATQALASSVAFSPDDNYLIFSPSYSFGSPGDCELRMWEVGASLQRWDLASLVCWNSEITAWLAENTREKITKKCPERKALRKKKKQMLSAQSTVYDLVATFIQNKMCQCLAKPFFTQKREEHELEKKKEEEALLASLAQQLDDIEAQAVKLNQESDALKAAKKELQKEIEANDLENDALKANKKELQEKIDTIHFERKNTIEMRKNSSSVHKCGICRDDFALTFLKDLNNYDEDVLLHICHYEDGDHWEWCDREWDDPEDVFKNENNYCCIKCIKQVEDKLESFEEEVDENHYRHQGGTIYQDYGCRQPDPDYGCYCKECTDYVKPWGRWLGYDRSHEQKSYGRNW